MTTLSILKTTQKRNIRHPELWVGKYVRHMANWWDFAWGDEGYVVCEWTGKLLKIENEAYYGDYFDSKENAELAGYDECAYYSHEGLNRMVQRHQRQAA